MKKGIYFTSFRKPPIFNSLQDSFDLTKVSSLSQLKKDFSKGKFDFVFVDLATTDKTPAVIFSLYDLDQEIPIIVQGVAEASKKNPSIENTYFITKKVLPKDIHELLSFHKAKLKGSLQTQYHKGASQHYDNFFLPEQSPLAVVFTDAENSVFYLNENAMKMLDFKPKNRLFQSYLEIKHSSGNVFNKNTSSQDSFFEFRLLPHSGRYVNVFQKAVFSEKTIVGYVYFLDDVTDKHNQAEGIKEEKAKYEKLTGRLNEVLIHELDTNAYNVTYFKRKLDLEIKHAHKAKSDVKLFYFALPQLDKKITDHMHKKLLISQSTNFLLDLFPDPYILGHIHDGHWLVISQSDYLHVSGDVPLIAEQFKDYVMLLLSRMEMPLKVDVVSKAFENLELFKNSDEILDSLGIC